MSTVEVHATGQVLTTTSHAEADYYQGEANTVGGFTIDGVEYPAKADVPSEDAPADEVFDPAAHTVPEVEDYLAEATPAERERVLAAERDGKNRVSLVGEDDPGGEQ